jgi:hypothetical protein
MKVAVIGSRSFADYGLLCRTLDAIPELSTVVSGGAPGADSLGERYADERGLATQIHRPDWRRYGRGAGKVRNRTIVDASDLVVAFWDGSSAGTKHALDYARTRGTPVQVVRFDAPAP